MVRDTPALRWLRVTLTAVPWLLAGVLLAAAALLFFAWRALDPTPDKHIVLATGSERSAYAEFAKRYVPLLQAQGVTVTLRESQGSAENLALLRDPASGVQAAFVQGGAEGLVAEDAAPLRSLGSVAPEPLWLFYRDDSARRLLRGAPLANLSQLGGWRINTGPAGGGAGALFEQLAAANKLPADALEPGNALAVDGVVALVQGRVDALALVSAAEAPLVQYLLQTPGVQLFDFAQSQAYARRFPFLKPLVLPRGVVDLAADLPPQDVRLVAATASLLVREDLHPALAQLLVQAAQQVHGDAGWFARRGEYPNPDVAEWPLAPEAERFYRNGPPWLQRHLSFWLAHFVDRMWIVLLPLAAVLLPLSRVLPPLVTLRYRSRVFRWYADLRAVERALEKPPVDTVGLLADLERLEAQIERVGVPLAFTGELYDLRSHVNLVRRRLQALKPATG